jgi:hypothetical protein
VSTPIRPSSGPLPPGVAGVEGAPDLAGTAAPASAGSQAATRVQPAVTNEVEGSTASVIARLEAGEVTREQAIEGLVQEALALHGGGRLPAAQRAELEAVLRSALLDDPTLSRLLG